MAIKENLTLIKQKGKSAWDAITPGSLLNDAAAIMDNNAYTSSPYSYTPVYARVPYCRNCKHYDLEKYNCLNEEVLVYSEGDFFSPKEFVCGKHGFRENVKLVLEDEFLSEEIQEFIKNDDLAGKIAQDYLNQEIDKERAYIRLLRVAIEKLSRKPEEKSVEKSKKYVTCQDCQSYEDGCCNRLEILVGFLNPACQYFNYFSKG